MVSSTPRVPLTHAQTHKRTHMVSSTPRVPLTHTHKCTHMARQDGEGTLMHFSAGQADYY
uniref:Uncharacterized protein n=1 Tax=Anguilla anguilla TaxID=7936 RepID=A0A0E9XPH4_ANGAN